MALPDPSPLAVEIAPGGDPADPSTWLWQDVTAFVRQSQSISITKGRRDEGSSTDAGTCELTLDNSDGRFSPRNPSGAYYPGLGLNTPIRVRWGGATPTGDDNKNAASTTSHVAPSVEAPPNSSLFSAWMSGGGSPIDYTVPPSMTVVGVGGDSDGTTSTMITAREAVSQGATGTRTATASVSVPYVAASAAISGVSAPPVVEQTLGGVTSFQSLTLETAAGTQAGWWLLAIAARALADPDDEMPAQPGGVDAGSSGAPAWTLLADSGPNPTLPRLKVWIRMVANTGVQTVQLNRGAGTSGDLHGRLVVLSGVGAERFTGFVSQWPPRWDITAKDAYVPIHADGVLRRLRQQPGPLGSAIRRSTAGGATSPDSYWPFEDQDGVTGVASGLGGRRLRIYVANPSIVDPNSEVQFTASGVPDGSAGGLTLPAGWGVAGSLTMATQPATNGSGWLADFWVDFGTDTTKAPTVQFRFFTSLGSSLSYDERVTLSPTSLDWASFNELGGSGGSIILEALSALTGVRHVVIAQRVNEFGNLFSEVFIDGVLEGQDSTTAASSNYDVPRRVIVSCQSADASSVTVSHLAVWPIQQTQAFIDDRIYAGTGYAGEKAADRMSRLCIEEGVHFAVVGLDGDTAPMGPQRPLDFMSLLREAEDADGGVLGEDSASRAGPAGLVYVTRVNRYNQPAILALDVDSSHVADPPEPTDDDQRLTNSVTVNRVGGSEATAADTVSITQRGSYETAFSANVEADSQLPNLAGWLLHLGTVDEMRWPKIPLDFSSNPLLIEKWLAFPPGGRLTLDHTITQLPGVDVDLLVDGWTEVIDRFTWYVELNCVPASPWKVGVLDDATLGRLDAADSSLSLAIDSTTTSLSVTSSGVLWTTDVAEVPFDITIGGEVMTVTAITGATSPQAFTVTRSVNGIVKSHSSGAVVKLATPLRLAL